MPSLAPIVLGIASFAIFVAVAYRRRWQWTGLPAPTAGDEQRAKTLWDWLQLLGIPVALAALAFLLNEAQSSRDQRREDQRATQQRRTATDVERENTLRTYLAQMSNLMLDHQLLRSKGGAGVRNVARTATLTAVRRLDGPRRGSVVQFLAEARLLRFGEDGGVRVVVRSADLSGAIIGPANLNSADLRQVNFKGANLTGADLSGANLLFADLSGADLTATTVRGAELRLANLRGANLTSATFRGTDLKWADFRGANLTGAHFGAANLSNADLRDANLSKKDFRGTNLSNANLRGANLRGANLTGANLNSADLRGARGVDMAGSRGTPAYGP